MAMRAIAADLPPDRRKMIGESADALANLHGP
jgi:hypothetical protein